MHRGDAIPLVKRNTTMPEAIMELSNKRFGCVGIVDENNKTVGILTDGDLARNLDQNLQNLRVDDLMTSDPKTISTDALANAAMAMLNEYNISALLVTDPDSHPVGIVHMHDLLRIGVA
jgi:arabinose-5-phosphate isomerase